MKRFFNVTCLILWVILVCTSTAASEFRLDVDALPDHGLLVRNIDFGPVIRWRQLDKDGIGGIELRYGENVIPAQLVLDDCRGNLVARFPKDLVERSRKETLACSVALNLVEKPYRPTESEVVITETPVYKITQSAGSQGGLPSRIEFKKSGRVLDTHRWQDRLYHADRRVNVAGSKDVKLALLSDGPICRIVRQEVVMAGSGKSLPKIPPKVVYHWFYFKDMPGLIHVTADYFQADPISWRERHLLELHVPDGSFGEYVDLAKPKEKKKFEGAKNTLSAKGAVFLDGVNRIAMFGSGNVTIYDGLKSFGPYLLGNGHAAWHQWSESTGHESVWLHLDAGETEFDDQGMFYADFEQKAGARLSVPELDASAKEWTEVARNALFYAGVLKTGKELDTFRVDGKRFFAVRSNDLGMMLEKTGTENDCGVRLAALVDIPSLKLLTPHEPQSLFAVKLRETLEKPEEGRPDYAVRQIASDRGWRLAEFAPQNGAGPDSGIKMIRFSGRPDLPDGDTVSLRLVLQVRPKTAAAGIEIFWDRESLKLPENLTLESATLPTIRLAPFGGRMKAFYPQASGIVQDRPFNHNRQWQGRYPSGWSTMPWYALWDDAEQKKDSIGLYIAAHDRDGTTKEQRFRSDSQAGTVDISLEYPAENPGRADARFPPCRIVLEAYRGDWFDAALMYRDWV